MLKSKQLKALLKTYLEAYLKARSGDFTVKQKQPLKDKLYAEMWNEVKRLCLCEVGLQVSSAEQRRTPLGSAAGSCQSPKKQGLRRERLFCIAPSCADQPKERTRSVRATRRAQSAARNGSAAGLRSCLVPGRERSLGAGHAESGSAAVSRRAAPDTSFAGRDEALLLPATQGGPSYQEVCALARSTGERSATAVDLDMLDPTQRSFADDLCTWLARYKSQGELFEHNLPSLVVTDSDTQLWRSAALLLSTDHPSSATCSPKR